MSHPQVSIVLPIYNVAAYLPKCLDSLAAQTLPAHEIIAVDDGSTDESTAILTAYATRLSNLRIIRQDNGGLSVARNTGMAHAQSKWLLFVDADDFIEPDTLLQLVSVAEENSLDIAVCNARYHFEGRKPDYPIYTTKIEQTVESGKDWLGNRLRQKFLPHMVWMHLYHRDFLKSNGFKFIPGQVHEDVIWTNQVMLAAKRVCHIDAVLYNYRIRQIRSGADLVRRSREYVIPCSIENTKAISRMADELTNDPELQNLMRWQAYNSGNAIFHLINKLPSKSEMKMQYKKLQESGFFHLMRHNATTFSQRRKLIKIQALLILNII